MRHCKGELMVFLRNTWFWKKSTDNKSLRACKIIQHAKKITLCLLVLSTVCKKFWPRSGLIKCMAWSGSKLLDCMMVLLKEFVKVLKKLGTRKIWTLNAPITTKVVCFSRLLKCLRSVYGKECGLRSDCSYVCSGSNTQFVSNVRQLFAADDFSRWHFQMHFFLEL